MFSWGQNPDSRCRALSSDSSFLEHLRPAERCAHRWAPMIGASLLFGAAAEAAEGGPRGLRSLPFHQAHSSSTGRVGRMAEAGSVHGGAGGWRRMGIPERGGRSKSLPNAWSFWSEVSRLVSEPGPESRVFMHCSFQASSQSKAGRAPEVSTWPRFSRPHPSP